LGEPVAVWSGVPGGPALKDWLAQTAQDPRLRLTIVASSAEADTALRLAAEAGRPARVLIEPEASGPPLATLTYDQALLAQGLQKGGATEPKEPTQ
jgi:D-serine deaminase-like pyridoxal phosphate-dependent protein